MTISVIIPVYNSDVYLKVCLDSVVTQSLENIEIICINDGSSDKSQEILAEYSWKFPQFKIINQENTGAYAARNVGIKKAMGEYLCFIDSDDFYPNNHVLFDMYYAAKKNEALICGGSFKEVRPNEQLEVWTGNLSRYTFCSDGFIDYRNYQFEYGYHRFIYKSDFIRKNNIFFPQLCYYEDPVFFVKAMVAAKKFYALKQTTYCYRTLHKRSLWNYNQTVDLLRGIKDIIDLAKENDYEDLIALERARIENDYLEPVLTFLLTDKNHELLTLLNKINFRLFNNGQRLEYFIFKRKLQCIDYDNGIAVSNNEKKIQLLLQENENLENKIQEQEVLLQSLNNTLGVLKEKNNSVEQELKEKEDLLQKKEDDYHRLCEIKKKLEYQIRHIYNSTTWKVVNCFLVIPKYINNKIKGDRTDE